MKNLGVKTYARKVQERKEQEAANAIEHSAQEDSCMNQEEAE